MDRAAELAFENVHHEPVLLYAREALEGARSHDDVEVDLVVCVHLGRGAGNPGFDAALDLVSGGHMLEA